MPLKSCLNDILAIQGVTICEHHHRQRSNLWLSISYHNSAINLLVAHIKLLTMEFKNKMFLKLVV